MLLLGGVMLWNDSTAALILSVATVNGVRRLVSFSSRFTVVFTNHCVAVSRDDAKSCTHCT